MAGNLHILTLTPFYPSREDNVSGCFVSEALECLVKTGVRNTVFAVQPIYRGRWHPVETGFSVHWLRYFSLPGHLGLSTAGAFVFARMVASVRKIHEESHVDLIHAHGALPCGHAAMLLSEELKIPFVVSVHGLDAFSTVQVGGRFGRLCHRISERTYSASRRVICISERVREQVLEGMGGRKCRTSVVYNGVDPELFSPAAEKVPGPPAILSVGNLIPIKGHDLLIRSIASLATDFPELCLEIVGEGPERSNLETLAVHLKVSERVRFLGRQSRQQVAQAMKRSTVFALPSRYEALGCVYLEGMSTAKPVIGCRGQGIGEVIQHGSNGFLVGPDNDRELTLALAMLLGDESRRARLGAAARDTILDRFTLRQQSENLARVYRECVA